MKKSCLACQGYPTCRCETTRPLELSRPPRRVCNPNVNGWLVLERNKLKVTSSRVTRREGCLGYPRPYKWGLQANGWRERLKPSTRRYHFDKRSFLTRFQKILKNTQRDGAYRIIVFFGFCRRRIWLVLIISFFRHISTCTRSAENDYGVYSCFLAKDFVWQRKEKTTAFFRNTQYYKPASYKWTGGKWNDKVEAKRCEGWVCMCVFVHAEQSENWQTKQKRSTIKDGEKKTYGSKGKR